MKKQRKDPDPALKRWIPGSIAAAVVILVWLALGCFFFSSARLPDDTHKGEFLANLGNFLGIASALFAGLAFAGVCATIPFLIAQAKAARDQVEASIHQAEIADKTNKDSARQGLFLALSQRIGEVIGYPEIKEMPAIPPYVLELGLKRTNYTEESDHYFLATEANSLRSLLIPLHDGFRRRSLFRAFDKLLSNCGDFQREMFKEGLTAQIHDSAARMLIIKSLAEADVETLRIYGKLGINFEVLKDCPRMSKELTRRFSGKRDTGGSE